MSVVVSAHKVKVTGKGMNAKGATLLGDYLDDIGYFERPASQRSVWTMGDVVEARKMRRELKAKKAKR